MNRRQALSLLSVVPLAARLGAQTRPTAQHRVFLGRTHGLLLGPDGTLRSWQIVRPDDLAPNWLGLGHNNPINQFVLAPVIGLTNVVAAAAGYGCSFAVLADGRLLSWGDNFDGRLGTTPLTEFEAKAWSNPSSSKPIPVVTKFDAVSVCSESDHVVGLARDGSVYTWGKGAQGQLGIGPLPTIDFKINNSAASTFRPFPVRVPDLSNVVSISAGYSHTLALLKDGTVRAWGANRWGQVGDGTTADRDRPVEALGVRNAIAVAAGSEFSVALLADGTAMTWGNALTNALARNAARDDTPAPTPAPAIGARGLRAIAAGLRHVIGLTDAGTVMTWGDDTYGQLGRGEGSLSSSPTVVKGVTGVQSIGAMASTNFAVLANGRILTWGIVRPWTRPGTGQSDVARTPILLWLDGLDQP